MKKVKFMLAALTVVAAVGGALAFKARTVNGPLFCSTTIGVCPTEIRYTTDNLSNVTMYCTDAPNGTDCSQEKKVSELQ